MASVILLFFTLTFSCLCSADLGGKIIILKCEPAVGVVGRTINIPCSFEMAQHLSVTISSLFVTGNGQKAPLFTFEKSGTKGDQRFQLLSKNDPSLLLSSSAVSDEGEYRYTVLTNRGIMKDVPFRISVTAKYNKPSMSSWPEKIEDGGLTDLYCNASGGYPAGTIHWFDKLNSNWTKSASLEISEREDKLLHLSSKLTFTSFDSNWAPFKCVVLNSRFLPEEENTFQPILNVGTQGAVINGIMKTSANIVAPVVVIGSLLVGLLIALLLRGRCSRREHHVVDLIYEDEETALPQNSKNQQSTQNQLK